MTHGSELGMTYLYELPAEAGKRLLPRLPRGTYQFIHIYRCPQKATGYAGSTQLFHVGL
jgi:hypothetical protein